MVTIFLCSITELDINIKTCYNINMKVFSIKNAIILALTFKYDRRRVFIMKRAFIILAVLALVISFLGSVSAKGKDFVTDTNGLVMQMARRNPVPGIVFVENKEGNYRAIGMNTYPDAILHAIPSNMVLGCVTADYSAYESVKKHFEMAEYMEEDSCRWLYTEATPCIDLNLRDKDGYMIAFKFVSLDEDWEAELDKFLVAEYQSNGELKFDCRLIYALALCKLTANTQLHKMMDYNDGIISTKTMLKSMSGQRSLQDYLDEYYTHHPYNAPREWRDDYYDDLISSSHWEIVNRINERKLRK